MPNFNECILIGHLGKDPVKKVTATGKTVTNFTMATKEGKGDAAKTQWHNIVAWEKTGDTIAQYCKKGHAILIKGKITYRKYTPKDSENQVNITEIIAHGFTFISSPRNENGGGNSEGTANSEGAAFGAPGSDDETPF